MRASRCSDKLMRDFELPIKSLWKKILNSEFVPGIRKSSKDSRLPARERIISIVDNKLNYAIVKKELIEKRKFEDKNISLFVLNESIIGFYRKLAGKTLSLQMKNDKIIDSGSKTIWDLRGIYLKGTVKKNLMPVPLSDEYWYAWIKFHPNGKLITMD